MAIKYLIIKMWSPAIKYFPLISLSFSLFIYLESADTYWKLLGIGILSTIVLWSIITFSADMHLVYAAISDNPILQN